MGLYDKPIPTRFLGPIDCFKSSTGLKMIGMNALSGICKALMGGKVCFQSYWKQKTNATFSYSIPSKSWINIHELSLFFFLRGVSASFEFSRFKPERKSAWRVSRQVQWNIRKSHSSSVVPTCRASYHDAVLLFTSESLFLELEDVTFLFSLMELLGNLFGF